jgi:hypothetical protein
MTLPIRIVLATLSPALAMAGVAGDWGGILTYAQGSHHMVLHITGPDTDLKATNDSPDQGVFGAPVPSITLSGAKLQYSIPFIGVTFSGDVTANGAIVGTFVQHGTGIPLTLERIVATPKVIPPLTAPAGVLENGHYHHNPTGVEFDLPSGWAVGRTLPRDGDPYQLTVLVDPSRKATFASAYMIKMDTPPANIPLLLSRAVPMLIGRRAGQTGATAPHLAANYKIREGSEQKTLIAGRQAVRAIGELDQGGKQFNELLAWIDTEQTRTFFVVRMTPENLAALQAPFEQMLQSARIP